MRSLERVAKEKGMIKNDPIKKEASVEIDLSPTSNLTLNVLNLCAGLRKAGFDKHANDVEINFMNYKAANTLYETSKETGEDLVEFAHPEGSHKLENVDSDEATIEHIIDQQLKDMKMVDRAPTGKLATAGDILKAVKVVLGQDSEQYNNEMASAKKNVGLAHNIILEIERIINSSNDTFLNVEDSSEFLDAIENTNSDSVSKAKKEFARFMGNMAPGANWGISGVKQHTWTLIAALMPQVNSYYDKAIKNCEEAEKIKAKQLSYQFSDKSNEQVTDTNAGTGKLNVGETTVESTPLSPLLGKVDLLRNKVSDFKRSGNVSKYPRLIAWCDAEIKDLENLHTRYSEVQDNFQENMQRLQKDLDEETKSVEAFRVRYVDKA
jgi:hypothetical protein